MPVKLCLPCGCVRGRFALFACWPFHWWNGRSQLDWLTYLLCARGTSCVALRVAMGAAPALLTMWCR